MELQQNSPSLYHLFLDFLVPDFLPLLDILIGIVDHVLPVPHVDVVDQLPEWSSND